MLLLSYMLYFCHLLVYLILFIKTGIDTKIQTLTLLTAQTYYSISEIRYKSQLSFKIWYYISLWSLFLLFYVLIFFMQ